MNGCQRPGAGASSERSSRHSLRWACSRDPQTARAAQGQPAVGHTAGGPRGSPKYELNPLCFVRALGKGCCLCLAEGGSFIDARLQTPSRSPHGADLCHQSPLPTPAPEKRDFSSLLLFSSRRDSP